MYGYCREKFYVNHLWELKGYAIYCSVDILNLAYSVKPKQHTIVQKE